MATRFYLPSTGAAAVNPSFSGSWNANAGADRLECSITKIASVMTSKTANALAGATAEFILWRQYVSDIVAPQSFSGTLKGQLRCIESSGQLNATLAILVKVVSLDGSSVLGTLLSITAPVLAEFATALTNRQFKDALESASLSISNLTTTAPGRIVIEIGYQEVNTSTTRTASGSFGDDSATDLAEDETTTTANNPWIEFSQDIAFGAGPWSDNLNAQQAPLKSLTRISQTSGVSARAVGASTNDEAYGQRFTATATGKLLRVRFFVQKVGSPTDSIVCKAYDNNAGLPGTLLTTSLAIPAAMISSNTPSYAFEFAVPPSVVNNGIYHAIAWRTGALDASNYYTITAQNSDVYSGGSAIRRTQTGGNSFWEDQGATADVKFHIDIEGSNWYKFEIDRSAAKLRAYLSTNQGVSWVEQDSANAPAIANLQGRFAVAAIRKGTKLYVVIPTSLNALKKNFPFDTATNTWGTATSYTLIGTDGQNEFTLNVANVCSVFHNYREFGNMLDANKDFIVFQNTESVTGVRYRRVGTHFGSVANGFLTGDGTTLNYDLRSFVTDWQDWSYCFYTKSDSTQIQVATINIASAQIPTVVGGLSVSAVDQASAYPLGQGCHFWRDNVNRVAVPYVDGTATKVLHCEAGTAANTAANWASTTAIASPASESVTSNPGFLIADNEQGGKLFLFRVNDSTGKLEVCHDSGSYTWTEPVVFDENTIVNGCGGTLSDREVGMLLRDSTLLNLVFKKFNVFF